MEENSEYRLLNLSYFASALLLPQLEFATHKGGWGTFDRGKTASLFEIVTWLRLGTELGFFPKHEANQILNRYSGDLFPPKGEAWHGLASLLPEQRDLLGIMESHGANSMAVRSSDEEPFAQSQNLGALFRSALLLGASISTDNLARCFTLALNFLPDKTWMELIAGHDVDPNQMRLAGGIDDDEASPYIPEIVYAGFFRALDYMDGFRTLFEDCTNRAALGADLPRLRSRVLSIVGWRFNAKARRQRFAELIEKVNSKIGKEIAAQNPASTFTSNAFRDSAVHLVRYWNDEEQMIAQGASAVTFS